MTVSAEQGSIADVGSPVLIAADPVDGQGALAWTATIVAVATAVLLAFNAHTIQGWFDELSPGPLNEPLRTPIAAWRDTTVRAGLDAPRATINGAWNRARAARFAGEQPGQQGEGDGGA